MSTEYFCGAPRRPDALAVQRVIASGVIQSAMSPRLMRAWSCSAQLVTRYFVLYLGWTLEFMPRPFGSWVSRSQEAARKALWDWVFLHLRLSWGI